MSNPSFENIDRWLFELIEGNLSEEQIQQLEAFLLRHPELDVDRDVWEMAHVEAEPIEYPHTSKMIRRRPIGIYMMAGFLSMAIFASFGIYTWWSTDISQPVVFSNLNPELDKVVQETKDLQGQLGSIRNSSVTFSNEALFGNQVESSTENDHIALQNPRNTFNVIGTQDITSQDILIMQNTIDLGENYLEQIQTNTGMDLALTNSVSNQNFHEENELETIPVRTIEFHSTRNWNSGAVQEPSSRFSHVEHKESFSSRLQKTQRMIQRMMDYPVALKNLKDPYYHIPGLTAMDVNFGSVGTLVSPRVQTLSRLQWFGKENQQMTNMVALDGYVYSMRGGVGFQMSNSLYGNGQIMNNQLAFTYSPKFSVNRNILIEPAVRLKMGNKMLDSDKIDGTGYAEFDRGTVQEFYPTGVNPTGSSLWYRDMGTSVMVNTKWFYTGIQVDNIFRHYDNVYSGENASTRRAGNHFIATLGTDYESKRENIGLSPYIVFQKNEALSEFWFGLNTRFHWITAGAAVTDKLDMVGSLGLKLNRFAVNYNMDYTKSAMVDNYQLSHQLSFRFVAFDKYGKNKRLTF